MEIGTVFTLDKYDEAYELATVNGFTIEEIEAKGDERQFKIVEIPEPLPPTKEDIEKLRFEAYKTEVDPITCHIQRLGDEEQTAEVIAKIAALVEERKSKVEEIKARYPYPDEPIEEIEELEE